MPFSDEHEHVFVVGSARSGTSLVGSIIQSSPLYAVYAAETKLLAECKIKYGDIRKKASREAFLRDWFNSRQFSRSGLTRQEVMDALPEPGSYYEFLGVYMGMVAARQGCERWVDSTPDNANCLEQISRSFPCAKVIHVIRDGRAVSASKAKLGWTGVKTDSFDKALCYSALLWQKTVENTRKASRYLGSRYYEIQYEQLVQNPSAVIDDLSRFLDVPPFDESVISGEYAKTSGDSKSPLHTPNSIYGDMESGISANAAFRWKSVLSKKQICLLEFSIGSSLSRLGYPVHCERRAPVHELALREWRKFVLGAKNTLKNNTLLGRYIASPLEIGLD